MTQVTVFPAPSAELGPLEQRIREMLAAGRVGAARPMLGVFRARQADAAVLAELEARLAMAEGRLREAADALASAIATMPGHPGLHACRAEVLVRLDEPGAALADAAEAVLLAPGATDAKALLGLVLIEAGRADDAATCLTEAVGADPGNTSYRLALAEALHRLDQPEDAALVLRDGIRLRPGDLALRRAAILQAVRARNFAEAIAIGEAARRDWVLDAAVLGLLGHAFGASGRLEEAFVAYADASRLDPDDAYLRHLAAAGGIVPPGSCAPADYLRVVFDGYAERFDAHLLTLGYRVPGLIRAALEEMAGLDGPVTDVGCGTGLLAVACDDLAGPWTGVDLSEGMLHEARSRGLYERLVEGDIVSVLPDLPQAGLVLAGDVLCYFGDLEHVLAAMRRHLRIQGHAVLSFEEALDDVGFAIGRQGRFRHSERYVREACTASGFQVRSLRRDVLRWEMGAPVKGLVVTLQAQP